MMKHLLRVLLGVALLCGAASCGGDEYDDAALRQQIADLEARLTAAETVLNAYKNKLFINSVQTTDAGYVITFSDGSKATITNGKDGTPGKDGDTWIKNVTVGATEVTFEMTSGQSFSIPLATAVSGIQSIAFVPRYDDGCATVLYTTAAESSLELDFQLSPREKVADLAAKWEDYFAVEAILTESRAVEVLRLPISAFEADAATGIVSLKASAAGLGADFFSRALTAAATLVISDGTTTISSDYVPLKAVKQSIPANQIRYKTYNSAAVTPKKPTAFGGMTIESNNYADGMGVITFSGPLTEIGEGAFQACNTLINVELPDGLTTIGKNAFRECSRLTAVTIPASVTTVAGYAFGRCEKLREVIIEGRPTVGAYAFSNCKALTAFYGPLATKDHCALISDGVLLSFAYKSAVTYTVPAGVVTIGNAAFSNCELLAEVHLPEGLQTIEDEAFTYCKGLAAIEIPEGVTLLGMAAFRAATNLTAVTLPSTLKSLGSYALGGGSKIATLTIHATTPPSLGAKALDGCSSTMQIKVPASAVTAYRDHEDWGNYAAQIVAQE